MIRHVTLRTAIGMLFSGFSHSPAASPMISVPWKLTSMITIVRITDHEPFGMKPPFPRRTAAPIYSFVPVSPRHIRPATRLNTTRAAILIAASQNSVSPNLSTWKRLIIVTIRPKSTAHQSWLTMGKKLFMMIPAAIISDGTYAIQFSQYAQPTPQAQVEEIFSFA